MRNSSFIIILLSLFANKSIAQDITGLWKGNLYNDTTQQFYRYELAISEEKGKLSGYSHTWFIIEDKKYYGVKKVKIKKQDGKIIVEDDELIANNYPVTPAKNVRQLNILSLEIKDSLMILSGPFSTNRTKDYHSLTGSINIKRNNDFWQSALVPHLQELSLAKNLSFVREEEVVIAKAVKDKIASASGEEAMAVVVVNKKELKTEKLIINKKEKENKTPVIVNKKIIPLTEAQPEVKVVSASSPVKETNVKKEEVAKRKTVSDSEVIIKKPEEPLIAKVQPLKIPIPQADNSVAKNINSRNTVLQQTVYFKSDSLQLTLYDNGEVDGDTVSVLMNGNIIFAKERLSTNAVRKTIAIDPLMDSVQLIMYAENLGTIAPNTGLLVVKDGKDVYEIRFSGDLSRNAAIVFRRKK
ncbi:MAG: hypothetical protein WKF35_02250 [Ferruginibacter sp.]